jgi:tetratricopeptide (TPR) repeat protein
MSTISDRGLEPKQNFRLRIAVVAVLALCVAAAFLPLLGGGWVYDDVNLVQPSPALVDLAGLGRAISSDLYRQAAPRLEASPYWRPLAMASFWLDTRFGKAPGALHFGNILLHAIVAALLALVILRRHGGVAGIVAAVCAVAWWALHPENVEPVSWISCRYDLLCGVALLCLLAVPWRPGPLRAALYGLIFLAGLLSKESFGAMAVVVVAMDFADRRTPRAAALRWVAVILALVIWMVLRASIGIRNFDMPPPEAILSMIGNYPEAIAIYFWRAIVALPLTISHSYTPGGAIGIVAGMAIIAALVALSVRWRRLAIPAAIFLAGLIPVTGAMAMFHEAPERYFYIPSIGLALLVAELIALAVSARRLPGFMTGQRAGRKGRQRNEAKQSAPKLTIMIVRIVVPAVVVIVTLIGLVRLEQRLPDWRSDDALWAAAVRVNPLDPQANLNRAINAGRRGNWDDAIQAIEIAAKGDPNSGRIASTYAWALLRTGDYAGAVREAERTTTLAPYQPDGWYYLAFSRHRIGDHAGELAAIEKLLAIAPDYPGARDMLEIATCEVSGRKDCPGSN